MSIACKIQLILQLVSSSFTLIVVFPFFPISRAEKSIPSQHQPFVKCVLPGCQFQAKYGHEIMVATHCKFHYLDGQARILASRAKRCVFPEGCSRIATCGDPLLKKANFCARHKAKGCLNVSSRKCQRPGCPGYATYPVSGSETVRKARRFYCGKHRAQSKSERKLRAMCQHPAGCKRQPIFGDEEENIRKFCSWHKSQNDTYLGCRRKCEYFNCSFTPTFGLPDDSLPRFCKLHRQMVHVPVSYSPCVHIGCFRRAYYAHGNETASRCRQHRLSSQMHIGTRCQKPGCSATATYTDERTRSRRYCELHRAPEHVPSAKRAGRKCQHPEGCNAEPSFGTREGGERLFCARHKFATHVNTVLALCTSRGGCDKIAYYGQPGASVPLFCAAHR